MVLLLGCPQSTTAVSQALSVPRLGRRVAAAEAGLRTLKQQTKYQNELPNVIPAPNLGWMLCPFKHRHHPTPESS